MSYRKPSGTSGHIALSATVPAIIGGTNQYRGSITVTSNDASQAVFLYWGTPTTPLAATVKGDGSPLTTTGGSATFNYGLAAAGAGGTTPTLWGLADSTDQVSPVDVRFSEGS